MAPVPPRSQSPVAQLTTSPKTCMAMITTASLHPQRRRRNQPIPAVVRAALSSKKRIPTVRPRCASRVYAIGLRVQIRIESCASPQKSSGGKIRHDGTKEQENADRSESRRLRPESEVEAGAIVVPHLLNISRRRNP